MSIPTSHFDYAGWVTRDISRKVPADKRERWAAFFKTVHDGGVGHEPSPDDLEAFLGEVDLLDADTRERLADYRHFHTAKKHRRPSVWLTAK